MRKIISITDETRKIIQLIHYDLSTGMIVKLTSDRGKLNTLKYT